MTRPFHPLPARCSLAAHLSAARSFPTPEAEAAALIYNYPLQFTALVEPSFEQCYFFD